MTNTEGLDISQDVLFGITQLALEPIAGISPTTPPVSVGEFLTGRRAKGIRIERNDNDVDINLSVSVLYGLNIPEIVAKAQQVIREAVSSMTGLSVRSIDVIVAQIDVPETFKAESHTDG